MAVRYGIPVSEFLARHSSAEITELKAFFLIQQEPAPLKQLDPEQMKLALFKGK